MPNQVKFIEKKWDTSEISENDEIFKNSKKLDRNILCHCQEYFMN